jgi:hypothetical protein
MEQPQQHHNVSPDDSVIPPQESSFDSVVDEPLDDEEMTDVPMDSADHGASLPTADELRLALPPRSSHKNHRYWIWAVLLGLLVILAASIGIGAHNKKNRSQQSQARQAALPNVIQYLSMTGVSNATLLNKGGTPQSLAANWLANSDGLNLPIPSDTDGSSPDGYQYLSRYILAVLWYANAGSEWINQFGWLTSNSVCYWNSPVPITSSNGNGVDFAPGGAYCDQNTLELAALHLGE